MQQKRYTFPVLFLLLIGLVGCASTPSLPSTLVGERLPEPAREFRGVWVATVANIDWPSKPGMPSSAQKREALTILDRCVELHLNAVVLQVRAECDAFYPSELEPWSAYLTGKQGLPPKPLYDPLAFWIEEAHRRGLELHVWFNPYRARRPGKRGEPADTHPLKRNPEMVAELAKGYAWLIPTDPRVAQWSADVIMDVVRRYEVDGVHMDDYFYPYPSYNPRGGFPDGKAYAAYLKRGGKLSLADWRRDAVNRFVENIYRRIKDERPRVRFGLSPFGIWRPGHPRGIQGLDQHEVLYADARLWLREGWVDYYTPQLYWPISRVAQSYPVLLGWWTRQNLKGRNLWPGLGTHNVSGRSRKSYREVVNEIMTTRGFVPEGPGNIHFSMKHLMKHPGLARTLREGPYKPQALVPTSPWLDDDPPGAPVLGLSGGGTKLSWSPPDGEKPFLYVLYLKRKGRWSYHILPAGVREQVLAKGKRPTKAALTAVDSLGNQGPPAAVDL